MSNALTMLVVLAHPDDETVTMGGVLARAARAGTRVVLLCATRGEEGEVRAPDLVGQLHAGELGALREKELLDACARLGVSDVRFLGYTDSGMQGSASSHPRSLVRADRAKAIERVVRVIREVRPHVVVTHDERGDYGHPDHIASHGITVAGVAAAADPLQFREPAESPWQVQKLYFTAFQQAVLLRALGAYGYPVPVPAPESDRPLDPLTTTEVDITDQLGRKREALAAHRTQTGGDHILLKLPDDVMREVLGVESFTRAWSRVAIPDGETDLFAGLPVCPPEAGSQGQPGSSE